MILGLPLSLRVAPFVFCLSITPLYAQNAPAISYYGVPGYIEMPSAFALPDGTFSLSVNTNSAGIRRGNLVFQISPRITGVFRYSYFKNYSPDSWGSLYDRSFDLRVQLANEVVGGWQPALTVGLQDFGGTGVFGAEYLVASKHFGPDVTASVGIGWGRFGTYGNFRNPLSAISNRFDDRPGMTGIEDTGQFKADRFFRGDAAMFFGIDWQATERVRLSFEYSSDAMEQEVARMGYEHSTPFNFGLSYRFDSGATLGFAWLNGSTTGLSYSVPLNPKAPASPSGREPAPPQVMPGTAETLAEWGPMPDNPRISRLENALKRQGITLTGASVEGDTATVAIRNSTWPAEAEAWGRTARVLTAELPASVKTFRIQTQVRGMPMNEITVSRRDLEELEYAPDGAWQLWARTDVQDAAGIPAPDNVNVPRLTYGLDPYMEFSLFDPHNPLRFDVGAQAAAEWNPFSGFYISGAIRQKVFGTLDQSRRPSDSVLPHVRSDAWLYAKHSDMALNYLTAEYFTHPAKNLYGRITAGYLERMYGGISTEVLWSDPSLPYAFGGELNYVKQRDYSGLGFLDYDIMIGHLSAYYDFGGGYLGEVDVGRYLAGDWGTTLSLTRKYDNGFEVGAFATFTDVSSEDFGEGSFDKGIFLKMPLTWITGYPSRRAAGMTVRPILRDGGAQLSVRNRLYGLTRSEQDAANGERWGRVWR